MSNAINPRPFPLSDLHFDSVRTLVAHDCRSEPVFAETFDGVEIDAEVDIDSPVLATNDVVAKAFARLIEVVANPERFHAILTAAFGEDYDRGVAENLRQDILAQDGTWLPTIQLVSAQALHGALGAYSPEAGILIDAELSPEKASEVLLEEIGHHLDTLLKGSDSAGDEGEIFRRLVTGEPLSAEQLDAIRAEHDAGTATVAGQEIAVENWLSIPGLPDWLQVLVNPFAQAEFLVNTAKDIGKIFEVFAQNIKDAVKGWCDDLVANAKAYGKDLLKSMEQVGRGMAKLAQGDLSGAGDIVAGLTNNELSKFHTLTKQTLDTISAVQVAAGIEPAGRPLRGDEIAKLRKIFGDSVDFSKVVVKEGSAGVFSAGGAPMTMGNTIYMQDSDSFATLAHELTHVWQFQNGGADYALEAFMHQQAGAVAGYDEYDFTTHIHLGWPALNPEQQGRLIGSAVRADYFDRKERFPALEADYQAKLAAYNAKYGGGSAHKPSGSGLGGIPGGGVPGGRPTGVGGAVDPNEPIRAAAWNEVEKARLAMEASRPQLIVNGRDYTRELELALAQLRNRQGAP